MYKFLTIYLLFLILIAIPCRAQMHATLVEGDYAPITAKLTIEENNKKYKNIPITVFDANSNYWHATWTQFDKYKSKKKEDLSVIYYSRSEEGKTWITPKQINVVNGNCLDGDSTVKGPMPCVGLSSEVYVVWASLKGLAFQRSLDSGKTWLKEEKIINPIKNGWACKVDGIKTNGLPQIVCDHSSGEFKGRIYISWSDEKNGVTNKDVFLIYSDDKGETWTEPILVTYHPNHKEQFKPIIKIDPITGYLYIAYFDKQNYAEGKETDIYLALSKNGGLKFEYYRINEKPFLFNSNPMEIRMDSAHVTIRWTQPDLKSRFCLYEVILNDSALMDYNTKQLALEVVANRSFQFSEMISVKYAISKNALVSATITKPLEPGFEKHIVKNKRVLAGNNELLIDTKMFGLNKGNYVLTLYYNDRNTFFWITQE